MELVYLLRNLEMGDTPGSLAMWTLKTSIELRERCYTFQIEMSFVSVTHTLLIIIEAFFFPSKQFLIAASTAQNKFKIYVNAPG